MKMVGMIIVALLIAALSELILPFIMIGVKIIGIIAGVYSAIIIVGAKFYKAEKDETI